MKPSVKYIMVAIVLIGGIAGVAKEAIDEVKLAASAYLYGYPLVIMEETRKSMVANGGTNQLRHTQVFPDSDFRLVVRPNVDTVYTIAWIDLTQGPQILSMPSTGDRYYVLPFMDAWTNVFERRGTSTTGNGAQEIAVVGPDYNGELPAGIASIVKSPTNMVWLAARIQSDSEADVANVVKIQDKMALTPLNNWLAGERYKGTTTDWLENKATKPMNIVDIMDAQTFFSKMNTLMDKQYPSDADADELVKFSHLNIAPGERFHKDSLNLIQQWAVEKSLPLTIEKIKQAIDARSANKQGWNLILDIGNYGTNYRVRAAVARFGLGALPPEEASYAGTSVDSDGQGYNGKNNYVLHFDADKIPPVHAFWSLSMYDLEGFFIDNDIGRYAIGDRSNLQLNQDGSLDLYIQHLPPSQGTSNWLPAPAKKFNLLLRLYMVDNAYINGDWTIPAVRKVAIK